MNPSRTIRKRKKAIGAVFRAIHTIKGSAGFIGGMGRIVVILDVDHVLSIDEMAMLSQVASAEPEVALPA